MASNTVVKALKASTAALREASWVDENGLPLAHNARALIDDALPIAEVQAECVELLPHISNAIDDLRHPGREGSITPDELNHLKGRIDKALAKLEALERG